MHIYNFRNLSSWCDFQLGANILIRDKIERLNKPKDSKGRFVARGHLLKIQHLQSQQLRMQAKLGINKIQYLYLMEGESLT